LHVSVSYCYFFLACCVQWTFKLSKLEWIFGFHNVISEAVSV